MVLLIVGDTDVEVHDTHVHLALLTHVHLALFKYDMKMKKKYNNQGKFKHHYYCASCIVIFTSILEKRYLFVLHVWIYDDVDDSQ